MDDQVTSVSNNDANPSAASTTQDTEAKSSNTLFIGNLSWTIGDEELATFFTEKDEEGNTIFEPSKDESGALQAKVIRDRERNNRSKGFGFVTFATVEEAEKAKNAKDGKMLDNREVRIQFKIDRPREDRPRRPFNGERRFNNRGDRGNRRFDNNNNYNRMAA